MSKVKVSRETLRREQVSKLEVSRELKEGAGGKQQVSREQLSREHLSKVKVCRETFVLYTLYNMRFLVYSMNKTGGRRKLFINRASAAN